METNKVFFSNNGMFDLRGMLTMGLSAKQKDDAIGFFGNGFKYAVAIILRNLGTIKITTKGADGIFYCYEFFAKRENFRNQEIDFIYVRDFETGESIAANFTTKLGINWQPWQALRELYCNCKDEEGVITSEYQAGFDTVVEVECPLIAQAFANIDNYILKKSEPIHTCGDCEIYDSPSEYIYYRGVAVMKVEKAAFTYNIRSFVELTEDRTVKNEWSVRYAIQRAIQSTENPKIVEVAVQADCFERSLGADKDWYTSDTYVEVCDRLRKSDKGISESARFVTSEKLRKKRGFPEFQLNEVQLKMVDKAKSFLFKMDVNIDDYPIKFVTEMGDSVMGMASSGTIYISELPFNMGTKQVAGTLLEEWVHLKTGCKDFDRRMQNWLFDKVITLGENINGEPI